MAVELSADASPAYERVVLVTIDTLRVDHVSCYGYRRDTTPFLDSLAREGVLFENAISSFPYTAPSHASMLTGLHPSEHGVLQNGQELAAQAVDLATLYARAGYATAAFLNAEFLAGVAKGFDTVETRRGRARNVVDAAVEHLASSADVERLFLWVHLYDPHRWTADFMIDEDARAAVRHSTAMDDDELFSYVAALHGLADPGPGVPFDPRLDLRLAGREIHIRSRRDYLDLIDGYDALILQADRELERLHRAVQELAPPKPTLWIVTSDHGEGLGSHDRLGHGLSVFQEQVRVPLVVHASDGSLAPGGGRRVDEVVGLVDLFPTLVGVLGARVARSDPARHGASLWPLLRAEAGWSDRPAFSQRVPRRRVEKEEQEPIQADELMYALQTNALKVILSGSGELSFYDLESDPLEHDGRSEAAATDMERLAKRLAEMIGAFETPSASDVRAEWLDELRALGYVE